MLNMLSLKSL